MELPNLMLPEFPHISGSFFINVPIMIIFLVLFFIGYSTLSGVLMYHWSAYGMRSWSIEIAETIFVIVSLALFTVSGLAINYF